MKLADAYRAPGLTISFELYPPKTEAAETELFQHVAELIKFEPAFLTCTYGAGGSTRDKTLSIVGRVRRDYHRPVAAHLTCVGSTVEQIRAYLREARELGVDHIVALRGDPPAGEKSFRAVEGGLSYANELVSLIRAEFPEFGIAVAGYPEKHQEAPSLEVDLANLQRKVAAGADIVVTQLFYNNDDYFRFRDRAGELGIDVPIVPGILPITNFAQIKRITSLCGARLPTDLVDKLTALGDDVPGQFEAGVEFATRQVEGLIAAGVPGVHFYVLNKSQATSEVLEAIGQTRAK
ncbi:MAG: methylenetetrahydrofolate reductase [NAD(P)H] [Planctomycetaceae bacterium]|nr:methylenetetrahydrofolate reductase [NAD(P)H] [Planctomycetaceae bacterium]